VDRSGAPGLSAGGGEGIHSVTGADRLLETRFFPKNLVSSIT
jgi:hypothetical protein